MNANVRLVARREISERIGEKSFLISTGITLAIIILVVVIPPLLGLGGTPQYTIATDAESRPIAERAVALAGNFDAEVTIVETDADVTLKGGEIQSQEEPDDTLVGLLQTANQQLEPSQRPELRVVTTEPVDPDRDAKAGLAFFAILMLYGQLIAYGFIVASGVVEEKASRVIEVLLATIRPKDLLAGKVLGLGILGLGQLLVIAVIGVGVAGATGALDVDGDAALGGRPGAGVVRARLCLLRGALRRRGRDGPASGRAAELHDAVDHGDPRVVLRRVRGQRGPGRCARARLRVHPVHGADHDARADHAR